MLSPQEIPESLTIRNPPMGTGRRTILEDCLAWSGLVIDVLVFGLVGKSVCHCIQEFLAFS